MAIFIKTCTLGALENSFSCNMTSKARIDDGGDCASPALPPQRSISEDDVYLFGVYRIRGSHSGGGETPVERRDD
jgi:hypothetical protein